MVIRKKRFAAKANFRIRASAGWATCVLFNAAVGQIPQGWEIKTIAPAGTEYYYRDPDINDRGQVAFIRWKVPDQNDREVFLYDRGKITQLTDDEVYDLAPEINSAGEIAWTRDVDPDPEVEFHHIVRWRGGVLETIEVVEVPDGAYPSVEDINDAGQILWSKRVGDTPVDNLYLFDGVKSTPVAADGRSNQKARINKHGDIAWTKYNFFVGPWRSEIWARFAGSFWLLANGGRQVQLGGLSDERRVVWRSPSTGVELWEQGTARVILAENAFPYGVNDARTVVINRWDPVIGNYRVWLWKNGELIEISEATTGGLLGSINNRGEVAFSIGRLPSRGMALLTKPSFRADLDFDGDVDLRDYCLFQRCYSARPTAIDDPCAASDTNNDGVVDLDDYCPIAEFIDGPKEGERGGYTFLCTCYWDPTYHCESTLQMMENAAHQNYEMIDPPEGMPADPSPMQGANP